MLEQIIAVLAVAVWLYLVIAHGGFWRCAERDDDALPAPPSWPRAVAVVPARNEAETIDASIGSLLRQDYPGPFSVLLVDDDSSDGTAEIAAGAATAAGRAERLTIVTGSPLPGGWAGKLWALQQGIDVADRQEQAPTYLLLTDADIVHAPDLVRSLVARAEAQDLVLTSLMAKLRCQSLAERLLVPAFIFFFQMLYPFSWVNRRQSSTAGAAGGCMLVRADALRRSGGIEAIRHALIDDCALAHRLKAQGPIWLGLTERVHSIRAYPHIGDIRRMVARSAYAQLRYSPLLLAGTVIRNGACLSCAATAGDLRGRNRAMAWHFHLGADGTQLWADTALLSRDVVLGHCAADDRAVVHVIHARFRLGFRAGTRWPVEGSRAGERLGDAMTAAETFRTGKGHRDENFPVASVLIRAVHRPAILAFYNFVRTADDIADHPTLPEEQKLAHLDALEASLLGTSDSEPVGCALAAALKERGLSPRHAQDLLAAFRRDATKLRYHDWNDLIDYCRYSAMPVGRFVLDVHGESRETWAANDALCAALQVINHLQDCGEDYRNLDRVYVPLDALAAAGARVEELGAKRASPALRSCLVALAERTEQLLDRELAASRDGGGHATGIGDHGDPGLCHAACAHAAAARSFERARASGQAGLCHDRHPRFAARTEQALRPHACGPAQAARGLIAVVSSEQTSAMPTAAEATRASGSSFYTAMRILPPPQREAMYEIYAFCRAVDDIADSSGPRAERRVQLAQWRNDIDRLYAPEPPPILHGLAEATRAFSLAREDFLAVIDGMEMDVDADIQAPDWATLDLYCDRVASAVGPPVGAGIRHAARGGQTIRASSRPRTAAHQHPARSRRGCRRAPPLSAARGAAGCRHHHDRPSKRACASGARNGLRRGVAKAWTHFVEADQIMRSRQTQHSEGAAHHGRSLSRHARTHGRARLGSTAPARAGPAPYLLWIMLRYAIL